MLAESSRSERGTATLESNHSRDPAYKHLMDNIIGVIITITYYFLMLISVVMIPITWEPTRNLLVAQANLVVTLGP